MLISFLAAFSSYRLLDLTLTRNYHIRHSVNNSAASYHHNDITAPMPRQALHLFFLYAPDLRHSYTYQIRNLEDGRGIIFSKFVFSSTRMNRLQVVHNWISKQKEVRLTTDKLDRPDTEWVFLRFIKVQHSIVQTRKALLGTGSLPDSLLQKKGLVAMDTRTDNL